jgi:hypothetical protein
MQSYLEDQELWAAVEGKEADAKKILKAKAKIVLSLHKSMYVHIQGLKTAKEVWDALKKAFDDKGLSRRIHLLTTLITTRMDECSNVEEYVSTIIMTSHRLNGIGFKISDEMVGCILLAGLPEKYKPMIMGLESSGLDISADLVKTKILQEVEEPSCESSALLAKKQFKKFKKQKPGNWGKCQLCHKFGHWADDCPKLAQKQLENSKMFENPSQSESELDDYDQADKDKMLKKINVFCSVFSTGDADPDEFYLDSGATTHMVNDKKWVKNFVPVKDSITVANNSKMKVSGKGNVQLFVKNGSSKSEIKVRNVLVVPGLATNLLSVSAMTDKGHSIKFKKSKCYISDIKGKLIATGTRKGQLYKLDKFKEKVYFSGSLVSADKSKLVRSVAKKPHVSDEVGEKKCHLKTRKYRDCKRY